MRAPLRAQSSLAGTMTHPLTVLFAGVLAGLVHVLSGPDHVAAVAPLALGTRTKAWLAGLQWGLGHSLGVLLVGAVAWSLRHLIAPDTVQAWSASAERLVGIVLVGIGLWGLRFALRARLHRHEHAHEAGKHVHVHLHAKAHDAHTHDASAPTHRHTHAALAVGVLHGFAGAAHLLGVLPAIALPTAWLAATYLAGFGLGSVAGMAAFAGALGRIGTLASARGAHLHRVLMGMSSAAAVGVGAFWLFFP